MGEKQHIAQYLAQAARNRLVFCHEHIEDLIFTDVGKVMANALKDENLRSQMVAYAAEDFLADILSSPQVDSSLGKYIALENIGILFEPELGFNLKATLDNASTNKTIIICSEAQIKDNRLYFLQDGDNFSVDLTGLSYLEI
jgi:hypothetical protein